MKGTLLCTMNAQVGIQSHSFSLYTTSYQRDTLLAVKGSAGRQMKLPYVLLLLQSVDGPSQCNRSLLMVMDAPFGDFQQHLLVMMAAVGWSSLHSDRVQCRSLGYQYTAHPRKTDHSRADTYHTYLHATGEGNPPICTTCK